MLALCEIRYDHYSRVANTYRTHLTRHVRLSRWSRTNLRQSVNVGTLDALYSRSPYSWKVQTRLVNLTRSSCFNPITKCHFLKSPLPFGELHRFC
jgi:hypothetical protein